MDCIDLIKQKEMYDNAQKKILYNSWYSRIEDAVILTEQDI